MRLVDLWLELFWCSMENYLAEIIKEGIQGVE